MRISGPNTSAVLSRICSRRSFAPHVQHLTVLRDEAGATVDQVTVVFNPQPRSYTGEDLAEIGCHANPIVVERILGVIASTGLARRAAPGEFTMRAFLNGKMDLVQAEAVRAFIESTTDAGCDMARRLLEGGLSSRIKKLRASISEILADIEASFISEDEVVAAEELAARIEPLAAELAGMSGDACRGLKVYGGVTTTIAGLPNVGKSSLFNAIVGSDRAIVHHEEGTTRDVIRERVTIDGMDFLFHDTAGIRTTPSGPEQAGVERAIAAVKASDLLLYVVDARVGLQPHESQWLGLGGTTILVVNKIDLVKEPAITETGYRTVMVSAKHSTGIDALKSAMVETFRPANPEVFLDRHAHLLSEASRHLDSCLSALSQGMTLDVASIELSGALRALGAITGESADMDILEQVFSRFCIGK